MSIELKRLLEKNSRDTGYDAFNRSLKTRVENGIPPRSSSHLTGAAHR